METATNGTNTRLGWVNSPDGRGTIDIVWGCLVTTFLCVWTVLNLNVPAAEDTAGWAYTCTKLKWMAIALFGPEWLFAVAGGQWSYARRAMMQFNDADIEWTMRQSFFADMGGIRVKLTDGAFPVNSRHLFVLVKADLVKLSAITPEAISDRSKTDGIAKLLTILQTGWFIVQCVARLVQHISITTLELNTISFVVCTIGTNIMWWSKPKDVFIPIVFDFGYTLEDFLDKVVPEMVDAKAEAENWKWSPMERFDDLKPSFYVDIWMFIKGKTSAPKEEQMIRFRNDRLPPLQRDWLLSWIALALSLAFGAVYVAGWNISLPTYVETVIWRVCITSTLSLVGVYWIVDFAVEYRESKKTEMEKKPVPPIKIAMGAVIATIYVIIRAYLLVEACTALRSLPPTAFQTVNWTGLVPHL